MTRPELEHIIRAVAAITNQYETVIIGSQSILGAHPNAPDALLQSMEADVYPLNFSEKLSDLIDGSIGEESPFHTLFGYYAQGVGPDTAILPSGWQARLVKIQNENTDLKIGYCLEPADLAASKLAANREKDKAFVATLLRAGLVQGGVLQERISTLPVPAAQKMAMALWVEGVGVSGVATVPELPP